MSEKYESWHPIRRYNTVNRSLLGLLAVSLELLGENIDHLLSDNPDGSKNRLVPKHPQKMQACWMQLKKKIHLLRRGPGLKNAPITTRMMRWRADEFMATAGATGADKVFAMMNSLRLTEQDLSQQSVAVKLVYCWLAACLVQLEMVNAARFYDALEAAP